MARWSLRLLGPFVAEGDGEPLRGFRSDKVRALLAYLAVNVDRPRSRSMLADLLWPDCRETTARSSLRTALSNLRHVLGDQHAVQPFLHVTPAAVVASGAADRWVDVDVFLELLPAAAEGSDETSDPAAPARMERALSLYRGDFLEGLTVDSAPFQSWQSATREQLNREAVRAVRALALAHAHVGNQSAATAATRRWLEFEPWDEAAHRQLMRLLSLQGQRAAALAQYETCRQRLAQELGVEPESETTRQYEEIKAGRAAPVEIAVGGHAWPGLDPRGPPSEPDSLFVARERELATLDGFLERAAAAQAEASVVFVTGEPGSGKTALLAAFARRALAAHPELLVSWGQCSAFTGRGDPFEPFMHALRMLSGEAEAPPVARASGTDQARRLWRCLPHTLVGLLDHGPDLVDRFVSGRALLTHARRHSGVGPDQLQRLEVLLGQRAALQAPKSRRLQAALFEQLTQFLRSLAERQPLLLVLDDLQWIDPGSVDLLFHLVRGLANSRVVVLCAYREEEAALRQEAGPRRLLDVVAEVRSVHGDVTIDLTHAAGPSFVDALLDAEPNVLRRPFRSLLYQRTSGNPLFTIELLRGMQLRGELQRDQRGRWVEGPELCWEELPARVEAVIGRRMGHLSQACRDMLAVASVEGEAFTAEVVAAVTRRTPAQVRELLSREAGRRHQLVAAHSVRAVDGLSLGLYRFRHGLYQTYLHNQLDAVEKARLHEQVGRELMRLYQPGPERYPELAHVLARHFEVAGVADEAVVQYATAARHALRLSAGSEAVAHLRSALRLLRTLPPSAARDRRELELQLALGPPLTASKGWAPPELAVAYARAQELCEGIEDSAQLIPVLWLLSVFRLGRSEHAEVNFLVERMRRLAQQAGDRALMTLTSLHVGLFYQGRFVEARRQLEEAAATPDVVLQQQLAQQFGMAPAVLALAYVAECAWLLDLPDEAERRSGEARALAERIGHPMTTCYALGRACWLAAMRGDAEANRRLAADLHAAAAAYGFESFLLAASFFSHRASVLAGAVAEIAPMHEAIERYHAGGTCLNRTAFLAYFAQTCGVAGDVARALAAVDASLATAERSGERWFQAEAWRIKGELLRLRARGHPERERIVRAARACLVTARLTAHRQGAAGFERRAAASLDER